MDGERVYLQPIGAVLNTISDIVELQKGKLTFSDTANGRIHFRIRMYGFKWEFRFAVADIGQNRSLVHIQIDGEKRGREKLILRELALLDSMLVAMEKIEFTNP